MRKYPVLLILLLQVLLPAAAFDGYVDVSNFTGIPVVEIYVSHISEEEPGENFLLEGPLADGETFRVDLIEQPSPVFNIRLVDSYGTSYTFESFDVEQNDLAATDKDADPEELVPTMKEAAVTGPGGDFIGWIEIRNRCSYSITELRFRQGEETEWSYNILGDSFIPDKNVFVLNVINFPGPVFQFRMTDDNGDVYMFPDVDAGKAELRVTLDYLYTP